MLSMEAPFDLPALVKEKLVSLTEIVASTEDGEFSIVLRGSFWEGVGPRGRAGRAISPRCFAIAAMTSLRVSYGLMKTFGGEPSPMGLVSHLW